MRRKSKLTSTPTPIPTDGQLRAFLSGQLSESDAKAVESYIETNDEAGSRLDALTIEEDGFIRRLRELSAGGAAIEAESPQFAAWARQLIGTSLGPYRLLCILGYGAMGIVYRAHDPSIDRDVAVKVLFPTSNSNAEVKKRFVVEAKSAGKLNHPNIITIFTSSEHNHQHYIVMELAEGGSVADVIQQKGPLPWREATRIAIGACEGLSVAHARGFVHRDIKPGNLLLSKDLQVKIGDFGLVKSLGEAALTATGRFLGTPHFTSPEQFSGIDVDRRSDLYSLGATYYAMLVGKKPFADRSTPSELMYAHLQAAAPDPRHDIENMPQACAGIIAKAMAKKPHNRYPDAEAMLKDLRQLLATDGQISVSVEESSHSWQRFTKLPEGPSIAVLPFDNTSENQEDRVFADGLTEEITTQLAKFKDLFVLARHTAAKYRETTKDVVAIGSELQVDYLLTGSVRRSADRLKISAQLLDTSTEMHLWAKSFEGNLSTQGVFEIEDQIAEQVAVSLGLHDGVIARTRLSKWTGGDQHPSEIDAYDCVTRFYENWRAPNPSILYADIRRDLEEIVKREPYYFAASAALAFVYLDAFIWDLAEDMPTTMLAKAGDAARRAVEGAPQDARALQALFRFQFHNGQIDSFLDTLQHALDANPNEANMLADAAMCLACLGRWDRSLALTHKALALNPSPPDWYHVTKCWHALATSDYATALAEANRMATVGVYWGPALRACALGHLGRVVAAQVELQILAELQPDFASRFSQEMQAWNVNDELRNATVAGFAKAGLIS